MRKHGANPYTKQNSGAFVARTKKRRKANSQAKKSRKRNR